MTKRLTFPIRPIRRAASAGLLALAPLAIGACALEDSLLEPQQPGTITPDAIASAGANGAEALYVGAMGRLQAWTGGGGGSNNQNIWMYSDLLTDVWKTTDTFSQRIDMDARRVQDNDAEVTGRYNTATQARGYYRDAIRSTAEFLTAAQPWKESELWFSLGYTEMNMAEVFCNGIPLGEVVDGDPVYSRPYTNAEVYEIALTHFDSSLALLPATVTGNAAARVRNAATIAKARTLVNLNRHAEAAALVAGIPTSYQYLITFSEPTGNNAIWTTNYSSAATARYAVGDSSQIVNGTEVVIQNALPFASAGDPRVPVTGNIRSTTNGFDGNTPWIRQDIWDDLDDPIVLASGVDARLIQAEAAVKAGDITGMMTILNALRTSSQTLGEFVVPAMTPLAAPADQAAAVDLLFREKAFWQFARGQRLGDLRRLIRQYGRTEETTFPEGTFHKTHATFGDHVNLPVPQGERVNPQFQGCLDRNA